jgi:hypothetical protein
MNVRGAQRRAGEVFPVVLGRIVVLVDAVLILTATSEQNGHPEHTNEYESRGSHRHRAPS